MGIRFTCPNGHRLHVKAELAGKRGICPECQARVQIPTMAEAEAQGAVEPDVESAPPAAAAAPPPPPAAAAPTAPQQADVWFVRNAAGEQWGPATAADVRTALAAGRVDDEGWAWRTGWPDWKPMGEVRPLIGAVQSAGASQAEALLAAGTVASAANEPPLPQPTETLAERLHLTPATTPAARPSRWQRRRRRQWMTLLLAIVTIVLAAVLGVVLYSR